MSLGARSEGNLCISIVSTATTATAVSSTSQMRKNSTARRVRLLASAVDMSFSFDAVCKVALALEHSDDCQDTIVVALARQPGLDFTGSGFAGAADHPHNLELFLSKSL